MVKEAREATLLVVVEPGVEGVGIARPEQALAGDGVRGEAVGHLEQGGGAFTDIGTGVMVAVMGKRRPLLLVQGERTADRHGIFLLC
jgi:hypothetical protein